MSGSVSRADLIEGVTEATHWWRSRTRWLRSPLTTRASWRGELPSASGQHLPERPAVVQFPAEPHPHANQLTQPAGGHEVTRPGGLWHTGRVNFSQIIIV